MGQGLAGISRRLLLHRAAVAAAFPQLTAAAAQAQDPARARFQSVRLRKSQAAGYLQRLRQSGTSLSQLALEGGGHCLITAGVQTGPGAPRLEL